MLNRLLAALLVCALSPCTLHAQTIKLGETGILGSPDGGNANLLMGNGPYGLLQAATIQSLSFYVTTASGNLRLGIYDSGPNNTCASGSLKAQTNSFRPGSNKWNTANVVTKVQLPVGYYCVVALASSNSLGFRKGMTSGVNDPCAGFTFGPMPATFPSNPICLDGFHWSLYATLDPAPTLSISFNPPNPSVPASSPAGTIIAQIIPAWSDGSQFTGALSCTSAPYYCDGGVFAIDGNNNLVVSAAGPGLSGDANTIQNITATAMQ